MKPQKWKSELSSSDAVRLWKISEKWTSLDKYRQLLGSFSNDSSTGSTSTSTATSSASNNSSVT